MARLGLGVLGRAVVDEGARAVDAAPRRAVRVGAAQVVIGRERMTPTSA